MSGFSVSSDGAGVGGVWLASLVICQAAKLRLERKSVIPHGGRGFTIRKVALGVDVAV